MPDTQVDKPLNELLSRSMVDIYVGPENTHWVLHEKLLCHHSPHFRKIFYNKRNQSKTYGLPDEEDITFKTFVGWLYSSSLPIPREEGDLGLQFDLYLMAEKFQIPSLIQDVLQVVREWYKYSDTYPGLRRVQYIYANTEETSPMRHLLVHSVARMFVLGDSMPKHWDKALRKNGQLAVDIIKAVQDWRLEEEVVPDARDDPDQGEELIGEEEVAEAQTRDVTGEAETEGQEQGQEQEDGEEEGQEEKQDQQEEDLDSSEDTVVESPREEKSPKKDVKGATKDKKTPKKSGDVAKGLEKLQLDEVPNAVSLDDYGTLGAH